MDLLGDGLEGQALVIQILRQPHIPAGVTFPAMSAPLEDSGGAAVSRITAPDLAGELQKSAVFQVLFIVNAPQTVIGANVAHRAIRPSCITSPARTAA